MSKLYYIEGPDGCGKTKWIEDHKVAKDMFYHNGVYESVEDAFNNYHEQLNCYEQHKMTTFDDFNCYMDRGPVAEMIYGLVMRGTTIPPKMYMELLSRFQKVAELEFIIFLPPLEVAMDIWASRLHAEYIKHSKKYIAVYHMYEDMIGKDFFGITIHKYDFTQEDNYDCN